MARQAEPWRRKGRPGWWAWIDGRQVKLLDAGTKTEAWEALKRHQASNGPARTPRANATVVEACEAFLEHSQATQHPATYDAHRWRLQIVSDGLGAIRLAVLTKSHVERLVAGYKAAPDSVRGMIASLRKMLGWCREQKPPLFGPEDPTKGLKLPPARRRERIVSPEERARLLAAAQPDFRLLLEVLGELGARPHIAYELTTADVDWTERIATRSSKSRTYTLYLSMRAVELLKPLTEKHPEGPLLRTASGAPWNRNVVRLRFRRLCAKLGITSRVTAYAFRHTFATDAIANGIDVAIVGELLNHKDLNMISKHYAHLVHRRAEMLRAVECVGTPSPEPRGSVPPGSAADGSPPPLPV
ncbi:MAG: tyrosine-type recombinase/integrase [Phycisphaerales bacterium]